MDESYCILERMAGHTSLECKMRQKRQYKKGEKVSHY